MLLRRPPLAPVAMALLLVAAAAQDVGPIEPEEWRVVPWRPGPSSDTIYFRRAGEVAPVVDTLLSGSVRTALHCYKGGGPFRGVVVENSRIFVEPNTVPDGRAYFGFRGYDMIDTRLTRVEITGFGQVTRHHDEGHAIYLNLAGELLIERSLIHHNGAQALQLVNRPGESTLPPGPAAGAIVIRDTHVLENGFNPDRRGFQVSIFGTGQAIVMEDVVLAAGFDGTAWPKDQTGGALLVEAEPHDPRKPQKPVWWRPVELPEDWEPPFAQGPTRLERVDVRHRNPDRPLVAIKGCEELVVRDCHFSGGSIDLDNPRKPGRDCGKIVWLGNRGDAPVYHRGVRIGTAADDFELEPE